MDHCRRAQAAFLIAGAICLWACAPVGAVVSDPQDAGLRCRVEVEEVVTRYAPANNGAGPLWCYGSPFIARRGNDVFLSAIGTGEKVPPLLNTRWQLWVRSSCP